MPFRGYFALNGVEIANSSRVAAHIGAEVPTSDLGLMSAAGDCSLTPIDVDHPLLMEIPDSSVPIEPGALLYTVPDGSRLYSENLLLVGDCWTPDNMCFSCRGQIGYDDSWTGLQEFLSDSYYRPELAPWYSTRVPESAEFGGIWVMDVKGLDTTPVQREITEMAGSGGSAGPHRDAVRKVTFDALLVACTNAGLTFGLQWLTCALRDTNARTDSVLRYLAAHPGESSVDPIELLREVHGVVLTRAPEIQDAINAGRSAHQQATVYRVTWDLAVTLPYSYLPPINLAVEWDTTTVEPIQWVHNADCTPPPNCATMPPLFAEGCNIEHIEVVTSPPPACGGCMPVCAVTTHVFEVPTFDYPLRCRETAVTLIVRNKGDHSLSLQGYWRRCNFREECDDQRWQVQITGQPIDSELTLDGITGRYWVDWLGRRRRPFGMISTPSGAPWQPPVIDRAVCWEFVVIAPGDAEFEIDMRLADREA